MIAVTSEAPHVRASTDFRWVWRAWLVALLPSLGIGAYNAGFQANTALRIPEATLADGWRADLLSKLEWALEPSSVLGCTVHGALYLAPLLAVALLTGAAWEALFAAVRKKERIPGGAVFATLFTLSLPPTVPLWQAAVAMSFATVLGKEVFGGTGRNFMHPAVLGVVFLTYAYPSAMRAANVWVPVEGVVVPTAYDLAAAGGAEALAQQENVRMHAFLGLVPGPLGTGSVLACLLGACWLLVARVVSWRIPVAVLAGMLASALVLPHFATVADPMTALPWHWHALLGSFAFGAVFLATEPASAAATSSGQWVYGLLIGFLVVLIRVANPAHPEGVAAAILLGNAAAPLIDSAVIHLHVHRRNRRA